MNKDNPAKNNEKKEPTEIPKEVAPGNVVDKKKEVSDWVNKFSEEITKVFNEMTQGTARGGGGVNIGFLEENMIRKMMVKSNLLSDEVEKELEKSYREGFAGVSLSTAKIGTSQLDGISEIPKEAADIEDKAYEIMEFCENGLVDPQALKERIQNEIDNVRISQINEKSGITTSQEKKPGLEKLQEYAKQLQYVVFKDMVSSEDDRGEEWKARMETFTRKGKSQEEVFKIWMNDSNVKRYLEADIFEASLEKRGIKGGKNVNNYRKIKMAEIIGMINHAEAKSLEAGLKEA